MSFSPSPLGFGDVSIFASESLKVTVQNTSAQTAVNIQAVTTSAPFSVTIKGCPAALAPLAACTVTAKFKPSGFTTYSLPLTFTDDDAGSPQTVTLTGTGTLF